MFFKKKKTQIDVRTAAFSDCLEVLVFLSLTSLKQVTPTQNSIKASLKEFRLKEAKTEELLAVFVKVKYSLHVLFKNCLFVSVF